MRRQEYQIELKELRTGTMLNYKTDEGVYPTIIDWQDIKRMDEDPEGFRADHSPIVLTEELMKKIRRVERLDFKPIEFSVTPPGERQTDNNYWSKDIHDFSRLHLSPQYRRKKVFSEDDKKEIWVPDGDPEFWYCWICSHGTGSSWFMPLVETHQLRFFHQLQDIYMALIRKNIVIPTN